MRWCYILLFQIGTTGCWNRLIPLLLRNNSSIAIYQQLHNQNSQQRFNWLHQVEKINRRYHDPNRITSQNAYRYSIDYCNWMNRFSDWDWQRLQSKCDEMKWDRPGPPPRALWTEIRPKSPMASRVCDEETDGYQRERERERELRSLWFFLLLLSLSKIVGVCWRVKKFWGRKEQPLMRL